MTIDQLVYHILADPSHILWPRVESWLRASNRFRGFAETYRDKIRKKLRNAGDHEAIEDVAFELDTAYLLLQERRLELEYEPLPADRTRSADFAATFKGHVRLHVEVKRNRVPKSHSERTERTAVALKQHEITKWTATVYDKLGQMSPGYANLLVMSAISPEYQVEELHTALTKRRMQAESGADDIFRGRGFAGAKDFLRQYRHLSAIIIRPTPGAVTGLPTLLWFNSLAKYPIPGDLRAVLQRLSDGA